jgi:hypothetical protein
MKLLSSILSEGDDDGRGSWSNLHTLAQLARRAGISEGRARALHADKKLPRPDRKDADGRPLWLGSTIDAWCRQTGRPLRQEVSWVYRVEPATQPAPVLFHGILEAERYVPLVMHAIVWDTPNGHIAYLAPVHDKDAATVDAANEKAAVRALMEQLIEPVFWARAVVAVPLSLSFGGQSETVILHLYHLKADETEEGPAPPRFGLRRLKSLAAEQSLRLEWGVVWPEDLTRVIGAPVPIWLEGTCTRATVRRAQAYTSTFTVPDTVTDWPPALRRLEAAVKAGMPEQFPAAFGALAADVHSTLEDVRGRHARQPLQGNGWYLVARPAVPEPPITIEQIITSARPSEDLDAMTADLQKLRRIEPDLSVDADEGGAYKAAINLLTWQVRKHRPEVAIDYTEPYYCDEFVGPVIDQWRQTLTEVDREVGLRTRRVRRLLGQGWEEAEVEQVLHDPAGRYVAVIKSQSRSDQPVFSAEWPYRLPIGWNERTIIAADPGKNAVFALTPTDDGQMRVEPVPFERGTGPSFGYGYDGGSPFTLYQALIRCAFGEIEEAPFTLRDVLESRPDGVNRRDEDVSHLWHAIVTAQGPLRLPWPQVQRWAHADAERAGYRGTDEKSPHSPGRSRKP